MKREEVLDWLLVITRIFFLIGIVVAAGEVIVVGEKIIDYKQTLREEGCNSVPNPWESNEELPEFNQSFRMNKSSSIVSSAPSSST